MKLVTIAYKNLTVRKIRTGLTVGGVTIAVMILVSLLGFDAGYEKALIRDVDKMGFQLLVTAKGCPYEAATLMLKGGGGLRYMEEDVYQRIVSDERVDKVTPQLAHTVFDPDKGDGRGGLALYMGIHPSFLELKPWMKFASGSWYSNENADEVIMGYEAAELEQRKVGDKIFIPRINKILTVRGIFERSGNQDDGIIFLPLLSAQRIFEIPNQLTGIGIKLKDFSYIRKFEEDLYEEPGIQVISMAQVKGTIFNLISSAKILVNSTAIIALIIAIIGVINTILMSVFERTREIGVMKALGASRFEVFQIICFETTLICFFGGIVGSLLAKFGGQMIEQIIRNFLPFAPQGQLILISTELLGAAILGAIAVGLIAGFYPAFRASSMVPVEAIRKGE